MDLDWLRDFQALVEHRTFSRAAEARNVTQPAFSRRIRALEDWLGTPLFVRGAQGAMPTPAGRTFEPHAADLLHRLERARRETRGAGDADTATLSIAATHALSFTFFPRWIRAFAPARGLGTLNLVSDTMEACESILFAGEVHFLLCHAHPDARGRIEIERVPNVSVGTDVLTPLCAPADDGSPKWSLPGTAAERVPHLAYSGASGLGRILAASGRIEALQLDSVFTSHLAATLLTMARDGHGVAWLPLTLAEEECDARRLVRAGPERFDIPIDIRLLRSIECRNRAADAFWAQVQDRT